jgi:hypothetical protein
MPHFNQTHGHASGPKKSETYIIWRNMKRRCCNPIDSAYSRYGERGITLCEKWMRFEGFLEDMGVRPNGLTLDRRDNGKGYSKENCKWSTYKEQARNTRSNVYYELNGVRLQLVQWAEKTGIRKTTIWARIKSGWSIAEALTTPTIRFKSTPQGGSCASA